MTTNTPRNLNAAKTGFTLVEVVIALGILVVMITGFMAVFGPAAQTIKKTLSTDEASRLQATLELELRTVRQGRESRRYQGDPFQKAIDWIAQSEEAGETVIIYKYRGIPGKFRNDGTLEPADRTLAIAGRDFLVQPMVRRLSDPLFEEDLQGVEGRVFFVKLRQLVYEGQGLRVSEEPGTIVDPNVPGQDFAQSPGSYPEAVIAFEAEYYSLPTTTFSYLSSAFDPNNFTRPIFARNLVVRR
ncbi:prepilin-type N-terminal cleavage/methylation domain-containing protein [Akkermansiaceae bacterium]|nr:prepilin-type N-terminal cleavage/methylation domain-containing protein [Akkermansiaceae bacterium]MDB4773850.1 prepilin-type N-terminal cleavage/methylation domain-containing protein [Akkermansiaceae bacterium]